MSINLPTLLHSENLSYAWGKALLNVLTTPQRLRGPLVVSVTGFVDSVPAQDGQLRTAVDEALAAHSKPSTTISGMMIFPYNIWHHRGRPNCKEFSDLCTTRLLPRLKAMDQRNRLGTYFERMMAFTGSQRGKEKLVNQLDFVIGLLNNRSTRWPRQSALQLCCIDPAKDHTRQPVRGFPCLQQVSITHDGTDQLALNGYYPTQYIFDRGYGNYLGLCNLGEFIAHETGLRLSRLNCFIGEPHLGGNVAKGSLQKLSTLIRQRLASHDSGKTDHV